jgi:protease-4
MNDFSRSNPVMTFLRGFWRVLDGLRRVIHLVLLLVVALVLIAVLTPTPVEVPRNAALVIAPSGMLVDELSGSPLDRAIARAQGLPPQETLLRDLIESLQLAQQDDRISAVVLDLSRLTGGGLSKLQELAGEVRELRAAGKPILTYGEGYTQGQYLVAAQADEVYLHPWGGVALQGLGYYVPFLRRALDSLLIDINVISVGEFKSAVEPFTRDDMSPGEREVAQAWLTSLWSSYRREVAAGGRGLEADAIDAYIEGLVPALEAQRGDSARVALESGLVDALWHRDEFEARMRELVAADDNGEAGFRAIDHDTYLLAERSSNGYMRRLRRDQGADSVAVITATGMILPGAHAPGTIGSDSTSQLIRYAREDERVRALVLRIDSGGGSAFASEILARELELFRDTGRPLVVSMGSVAASGGYMIALPANEIWASPATLTGSIGVYSVIPTFPRALDRLGISIDGISTGWLAGQFRLDRELSADARRLLELGAEHVYERFVGGVAADRNLAADEVERVAEGRVFSGIDAARVGLVDELGTLADAINSAAQLAGLEPERWIVRHIEVEPTLAQRVAMGLLSFGEPGIVLVRSIVAGDGLRPLQALLGRLERELLVLQAFGDPRGVAMYCLVCELE